MSMRNPAPGRALVGASLLIGATTLNATPITFTLDPDQSYIQLTLRSGSNSSNSRSLTLAGDFTLDVNPAAPGNWDGTAVLTDVLADSQGSAVTLSIPGMSLTIDGISLTGVDMNFPSLPATMSGGPGISSGTQYGLGILYEVAGSASVFGASGPVAISDIAIGDWDLALSDAPLLGIAGPGNVQAVLTSGFSRTLAPLTTVSIDASIRLAGTASFSVTPVPLPGALLLMLSGLAGLLPAVRGRVRRTA